MSSQLKTSFLSLKNNKVATFKNRIKNSLGSMSRPGAAQAREVFLAAPTDEWEGLKGRYSDAILAVANKKRKPELPGLDAFWREDLLAAVSQRSPRLVTLGELSRVMQWKLLRGKFRPLQKIVDSNNAKQVESVSQAAFRCLDAGNWKGAFEHMTKLRGIGQATASAVLAPFDPRNCPFMADEVMEAVLNGQRDYTAKIYCAMRTALVEKAEQLGEGWTAEDVGRALWTKAVLCTEEADRLSQKQIVIGDPSTCSGEMAEGNTSRRPAKKRRST